MFERRAHAVRLARDSWHESNLLECLARIGERDDRLAVELTVIFPMNRVRRGERDRNLNRLAERGGGPNEEGGEEACFQKRETHDDEFFRKKIFDKSLGDGAARG